MVGRLGWVPEEASSRHSEITPAAHGGMPPCSRDVAPHGLWTGTWALPAGLNRSTALEFGCMSVKRKPSLNVVTSLNPVCRKCGPYEASEGIYPGHG
jgi:hypothetical protein